MGSIVVDGGIGVVKNKYSEATIQGSIITDGVSILTSGSLTNLTASITADKQATTKEYVDNLVIGLRWLDPVKIATTTEIVLNNVTEIDGETEFVNGDRVLQFNLFVLKSDLAVYPLRSALIGNFNEVGTRVNARVAHDFNRKLDDLFFAFLW